MNKKGLKRFFAVTGLVAFCLSSSIAVAQQKPELRIAAIISETGAASALGAPERKAMDLFSKTWGARTELPFTIKIINYDDGSDPTKSVSLSRKAIEEDGVHVVICCTTSPASLALIDTVNAAKVTMISMASSAAIIEPAADRPFTFKTPTSDHLMLERTLTYMKKQGIERLGFFGLEDSYGETGLKELKKVAANLGIELVATERFARQDTNFTPQALRLRQSQPDAIYIHAIPPSANLAHEALMRVGYRGPVYHGAGASINSFLELGKGTVEGAIVGVGALSVYDHISEGNPLRPVLQAFAKTYDAEYGSGKVDMFAGQSWDAALLATQGFEAVLKSNVDLADLAGTRIAIKDAIEATTNYVGVNGIFNFGKDDHLGLDKRSTFLAQVKNGRFQLIEE